MVGMLYLFKNWWRGTGPTGRRSRFCPKNFLGLKMIIHSLPRSVMNVTFLLLGQKAKSHVTLARWVGKFRWSSAALHRVFKQIITFACCCCCCFAKKKWDGQNNNNNNMRPLKKKKKKNVNWPTVFFFLRCSCYCMENISHPILIFFFFFFGGGDFTRTYRERMDMYTTHAIN